MRSAICLIVRDEARDIAEWVVFHALIGFDTQIIFDNASSDVTPAILAQAAKHYDIRLHHWPSRAATSQVDAYQAAIDAYGREFDWIAFIDSDEFLVIEDERPVNRFLEGFADVSGIAVPWAIYGASGHQAFPDDLVIAAFPNRADAGFAPARHVKTILRPGFAQACLNPHCFDLRGAAAGSYVMPDGSPVQWHPAPEHGGILPGYLAAAPNYAAARINHYFTRSRAHFQAKLARGYPADIAIRRAEEFEEYNRNEIADPIAARHAPAVWAELARIGLMPPPG